jgi:hypothetical protein
MEGPTVWAAEHGASTPDIGRGEDASNVGHRWRIHGRLEDLSHEEHAAQDRDTSSFASLVSQLPATLDVEALKTLVARETEIDIRDVQFELARGEVTLRGTVADNGERLALVELLQQLPGVTAVHDRLLAQVG